MIRFRGIYYWRGKAWILEAVLNICFNSKARNRAEHIRGLEEKVKRQATEIRNMQLSAESQNIRAKALNILVACSGPCASSYMDDPSQVTQEVVNSVKRNADRLVSWWSMGGQKAADKYHKEFANLNFSEDK